MEYLAELWAQVPLSWQPAVVVGALGTFGMFCVQRFVQHRFDARLQTLKAGLQRDEEALRADLRSKADQIAALQAGSLQIIASHHSIVTKRRIEAAEALWVATIELSNFKGFVRMVSRINIPDALHMSEGVGKEAQSVRDFANLVWEAGGVDRYLTALHPPQIHRPFVSVTSWSLFSAYRDIVSDAVARIAVLRSGAGERLLADPKPLLDLAKSVLPSYAGFIDKHGVIAMAYLVDDLENALFQEIQKLISRPDGLEDGLSQSAAVLGSARDLFAQIPSAEELRAIKLASSLGIANESLV